MKDFCIILFFLFSLSVNSWSQETETTKPSDIKWGYAYFANYNLYTWHQKPFNYYYQKYTTGQALNVLPGVGFNLWFGDVDSWILALEGSVEYLPFEMDINKGFKGMGSLGFPALLKVQFPIAKQQSTWLMLYIGAGCKFTRTDLYVRPDFVQHLTNPFFAQPFGEIGINLGAVGYKRQHMREIGFFFRFGGGPQNSMYIGSGLRINFWETVK